MKTKIIPYALVLAGFITSAFAQQVSIPDPGLNAAIRSALHIVSAPLTVQDLLTLTNLDARSRNVRSTAGLEAARNLVSLHLEINRLTNFSIPTTLTNLSVLDLSANPLTNFSVSSGFSNLTSLTIEGGSLTNLSLPATLTGLTNLDVEGNDLRSFNLPATLTSLVSLDLGFNQFTSFSLPAGLTNLSTFYFAGNPLTNVILPPGLAGMTELNLSQNLLTSFTLPTGMTNLEELDLAFNQLANLSLPGDLRNLSDLELDFNRLTNLDFLSDLTNLRALHLRANQFTDFNLPTALTRLAYLDVSDGPLRAISLPAGLSHLTSLRIAGNTNLTSLTLPVGMTNLTSAFLVGNRLTNVVLSPDLNRLESLNIGGNQLTSLTLPAGLTSLAGLFVLDNLLTSLTLPPDMTNLVALSFLANPVTTLVLSESLAALTNLEVNLTTIASLRNQGIDVFSYPLTVQLLRPRQLIEAFQFGITGPPGVYSILQSADLASWTVLGTATNSLGIISFADVTAQSSPHKFYRALQQSPPADMIFITPNTFIMGSPPDDVDRSIFEGPQTAVTLTRGYWISTHEVTQGEYLAITGVNPSNFPGDLRSPVSSVSWGEATNYCAMLTQRELAAGRISPGSVYRLPTEAEWECAARAGTSTRFSYGDDPRHESLTNYAWFINLAHPDLTVHPVGQKLPNPWGLYDMAGNVWEWCQDWYGNQPGGVQIDPIGPASNPNGLKVMRGGAYDYPDSSCRSASRLFFHALLTDTDLGFRVVLSLGAQ